MTYIIGRIYNKYGAADYYAGMDGNKIPMFAGKKSPHLVKYTNHNTAYGMTIRLKKLLPTIIGGASASYEVIEVEAGAQASDPKDGGFDSRATSPKNNKYDPMQDTYGQSVCVSDDCYGLGE